MYKNALLTVFLFALDRLSKSLFEQGVLNSENVGARGVIIIISTALIVLLKYNEKLPNNYKWINFIVAGGVSNLVDVIIWGGVRDNIIFGMTAFNLADTFITIGIGLLIIELIQWKKLK